MTHICLITSGQPSSNPRLVKEADVLTEQGHTVTVVATHWADWGDGADSALLASRAWKCHYVGGHPTSARARYLITRYRQGASRRALSLLPSVPLFLSRSAVARAAIELRQRASSVSADLYVGHNLGALPAAVHAARVNHARCGYDLEDFLPDMESGQSQHDSAAIVRVEREYLPQCDYLTAASPGIGQAYADAYGVAIAASVLNVFPLDQRPSGFRRTDVDGPLKLYWTSQTVGAHRGLEDVIRAMGRASSAHITLDISGVWMEGYQAQLMDLALDVGVPQDRIHSLPVEPSSDNMVRRAATYDVGLAVEQPSSINRDICLTNKIFTYILAGDSLVLTATRAQRELADTLGHAAFCYTPGEVEALATQLRRWHNDRGSLEAARRSAWDWGTRRFNWDLEKVKFLSVIDAVLAGRSPLQAPSTVAP